MSPRTEIERRLTDLDQVGYVRRWAQLYATGPAEDTEHEIRVMLFEKLVKNPALCDKPTAYFFAVVRHHFIDLARRRQTEARHCEFLDPTSAEYETATAVDAPDWPESPLLHSLRTADPQLIEALLDGLTHQASGNLNHAQIATWLRLTHATYYRRLSRLQTIAAGDRHGESYQASLW